MPLKRRLGLKDLYESLGEVEFTRRMVNLIAEGKEVQPEDFSLRELWEATVGPLGQTLGGDMIASGGNFMELQEAIDTTAFPKITGALIAKKLIDAYNVTEGFIGDQLVTNMPSKKMEETIVGFSAVQMPKEVKQGMPYEDSDINEKYVTTKTAKKGRLISITEEMIYFDQTNQVLLRAQAIGEKIRLEKEKIIVEGVADKNSNVYRASGVAAALYSSGNKNLKTSNALQDWSDVDAARQKLATMKDENDDPIVVSPNRQILVPDALMMTAHRITTATQIREDSNPSAGTRSKVTVSANPVAGLKPLSSVFLDDISATTWFYGVFKKQYIWQDIWPVQVLRARQESEAAFKRDIKVQFKGRYYGGIAATDKVYVIKNTA